jgi:hypothetical protein
MQQDHLSSEPNLNPGLARDTDPETSHEAAESIDTTELEHIVYEVIKQFPNGCIGDDVVKMLPQYGIQTISPRYAPLIRKGWIVDTGEKRKARSGRSQRVMKVVSKDEYEQQRLLS